MKKKFYFIPAFTLIVIFGFLLKEHHMPEWYLIALALFIDVSSGRYYNE